MKKYQMPNVKEEKLTSSLFVMQSTSEPYNNAVGETGVPVHAPRRL